MISPSQRDLPRKRKNFVGVLLHVMLLYHQADVLRYTRYTTRCPAAACERPLSSPCFQVLPSSPVSPDLIWLHGALPHSSSDVARALKRTAGDNKPPEHVQGEGYPRQEGEASRRGLHDEESRRRPGHHGRNRSVAVFSPRLPRSPRALPRVLGSCCMFLCVEAWFVSFS